MRNWTHFAHFSPGRRTDESEKNVGEPWKNWVSSPGIALLFISSSADWNRLRFFTVNTNLISCRLWEADPTDVMGLARWSSSGWRGICSCSHGGVDTWLWDVLFESIVDSLSLNHWLEYFWTHVVLQPSVPPSPSPRTSTLRNKFPFVCNPFQFS